MISDQQAKTQLARLSQLQGFPNTKESAADMIEAIKTASTEEIAAGVIYNILDALDGASGDDRRCPTAPKVRKMIYDASAAQRDHFKSCAACQGGGAVSVPYLVTYGGAGLDVGEYKPLREFSWERANSLRSRLDDNQDVIGVGEQCFCRTQNGQPIAKPERMCRRCGDDGIYGGQIGGKYSGEWKWCDCPAGKLRQEIEPGLVGESNMTRDSLMDGKFSKAFDDRFGTKRGTPNRPPRHL